MNSYYAFIRGPLMWAAFAFFVLGSAARLLAVFRDIRAKEKFIVSYMSWKYGLRSILRWLTPFATGNWRKHPVFTIVTFSFHICLLSLMLFGSAHIVSVEESWGISWRSLPEPAAVVMAATGLAACLFFLFRRLFCRSVRYISSLSDWLLLFLAAMPFFTGLAAHFHWVGYPAWTILHILSGEMLLIAVPFTRLSHMLFFPLTRAYMGSEFGAVRHSKDW